MDRTRVWYLLVHQVPPRPLYLRAKIRQRLAKVGAVALKDAVYVLPRREDCLEDFEWIAEEARAGGGEAWICEAAFPDAKTDQVLVSRFQAERDSEYSALAREVRGWTRGNEDPVPRIARARKRLEDIARTDFFAAKGRKATELLIERAARNQERRRQTMKTSSKERKANLVGRTWVTRRGVKVDRISSAWFVRRFVDPKARLRLIDPKKEEIRPGEIGFDMPGGEFTHEGDRCTLETLVRRSAVSDRALKPITEIVHDIDLKDGKFGRPETAGVAQILAGLFVANPDDDEGRLERGFALFDELYASFRQPTAGGPRPARRRATAT
jgi:hypothetical protein